MQKAIIKNNKTYKRNKISVDKKKTKAALWKRENNYLPE